MTVAVAANEARRSEDALRVSLEAICAHTRWPVGHVLLRESRDGPLVSAGIWHLDDPDRYEAFRAASEELSFQEDAIGIRLRDAIGVDNMMWGSDYPHSESTFPQSRKILAEILDGVPDDEQAKIVGGNTARVYHFDVARLTASA